MEIIIKVHLVGKIIGNVQLLNGWVLMLGGYQYEVGITGFGYLLDQPETFSAALRSSKVLNLKG